MRQRFSTVTCVLSLALVGACGGEDDGGTDAGGGDDAGMLPMDSGASDDDAGGAGEDAGADDDAGGGGEDAGPADTWATFAQEFFATYCTECHSGGTRDYTTIDDVMRDADTIRCGVSPESLSGCGPSPVPSQFPVGSGPKPSDAERRRLVAWIDAGLPE